MRKRREETYYQEMRKVIDQFCCNTCGEVEDFDGAEQPTRWFTLSVRTEEGYRAWHFNEWSCVLEWANAHEDGLPTKLQEELEASLEAEREKRRTQPKPTDWVEELSGAKA